MTNTLTKEDISELPNLNGDAIKTYLSLAETRLIDALAIKKELDQKAFILLAGYIPAALTLFGLSEKLPDIEFWLNITGLIFCLGVIPIFLSLKASDYGTLGRHAQDWLGNSAYITASDNQMKLINAYLLHDHITRLDTSDESNDKKASFLNIAILLGMLSLIPFAIKFLFSL